MKKLTQFATPLTVAVFMSAASFVALAQNGQNNLLKADVPQNASVQSAGAEQSQAYRDGMEAAKLDTITKRKIDAKASHLYVHPPVKGADTVSQYRQSFEAGYNAAIAHGATS